MADLATKPVVKAEALTKYYKVKPKLLKPAQDLKAVDGASFSLRAGKTLAVVGESGCGKSSMAKLIAMIEKPTAGKLWIDGKQIDALSAKQRKPLRNLVQMIFQDPYGSLNPRSKVGNILEEPLRVNTSMNAAERKHAAHAMLEKVGLRPEYYQRYPHMFSGGQRQRVAIARALMLKPKVVVADEPVSALDISIQAQVLNLLLELQAEFNLCYLFISHGLSVVEHISDEVMVMYLGKTLEQGSKHSIFKTPRHPYTQALLASTPFVDPARRAQRVLLKGELPSPLNPPSGCVFHGRCAHATDKCRQQIPTLRLHGSHSVACHGVDEGRL